MADKIGTDEHGEILIYQTDDGQTNIEVKIEDDTVWLTQQQLTELYQCSKSNISEHIKHIFEEGELDKDSVVRKFRTTAADGKKYNMSCPTNGHETRIAPRHKVTLACASAARMTFCRLSHCMNGGFL